ncbi:hypothetical protein QQ045_006836 [Rhodiola kirilowii]
MLGFSADPDPVCKATIAAGKVVEDAWCRGLIREATDAEIWQALNAIGMDKSPGPDGFSASFFKSSWNLIGAELCNSIRHCLRHNALPKGINSTALALIPKINSAMHPEEFRPISCCTVVYKIISGVLAGRLKDLMPEIINKAQGAFVKGRSIVGNMNVAQQLMAGNSSIIAMKDCVENFLRSSGLSINLAKSQIFVAGMPDSKKAWVEQVLGIALAKLPVRYLGILLNSKAISAQDCSSLIDKITSRIHSWSNRYLSRVGRRLLIQSVLQSVVFFWARMCILPKKVVNSVNSICARFLWKGNASGKGGFPVSWVDVCKEKSEGGLGIKDITIMNEAMRLNQLWDLSKDTDSVWRAWTRAYWTKGKEWWEGDNAAKTSWIIKELDVCKQLSTNCISIHQNRIVWIGAGNGFNVKIPMILWCRTQKRLIGKI